MITKGNENIICISSIDWDFIWQGHQEIMSTLAREGNRVIFIENTGVRAPGIRDIGRIRKRIKNWFRGVKGIRKEAENLYVFSPLILPFPYSAVARWINKRLILSSLKRWMRVMDFNDPVVWTFLPTGLSLDIIDSLVTKLVIYYCIDSFTASSRSAGKVKKPEINLLKKADLVFVTSRALHAHCSEYSDRVHIFPFAVNFAKFQKARLNDLSLPDELRKNKHPMIGYVGGIHKWIDQDLVKFAAEELPECSFIFVGPLQASTSLLSGLKNVHFLGGKDHEQLPSFIKEFDACIVPYALSEYTKNVYPTKLNEYLAMGKAVVSTNLPEIEAFNKENNDIVYISDSKEKFSESIRQALSNNSHESINRRVDVARKNSWENRIEQMNALIQEEISRKKSGLDENWRENLLNFYKRARGRMLRLAVIYLTAYLVLFHTSFIWFLAEPLKAAGTPQRADAIVVFAGGVGESGKAGQGYEERVQYAVDLYRRGLARKMIFASGYKYVLEEAEVMKALAVSMGIPRKDIFLEDKATTTHEYARNVAGILQGHGWNSVLLVSSPYHMRRAGSVFDKIAPQIKVYSAPIPNSLFYLHENNAKPYQIKAILHEYIGIVYYWFKGYI